MGIIIKPLVTEKMSAFSMPDMAGSHITGSPLYICLYLCCF